MLTEPGSSFTLVYGNRNRHSIIFKEELEALKNKYMHRFNIIYILSREMTDAAINYGRIDAAKCSILFEKALNINADDFLLCGPEEMTLEIKDFLKQHGVAEDKIHVELFNAGNNRVIHKAVKPVVKEEPKSKVTIKRDGILFNLELAFEEESILDAAIHQGTDLPYSCKAGVCCTCRAKLLEGEVEMEVCYGLEPEEIKEGYILTCQSHPKTPKIVIDFDAK
jgi:ring-1,2-phenylacetyl-CoA epoxidase subunit PaaE